MQKVIITIERQEIEFDQSLLRNRLLEISASKITTTVVSTQESGKFLYLELGVKQLHSFPFRGELTIIVLIIHTDQTQSEKRHCLKLIEPFKFLHVREYNNKMS